eukprot:SAG11_NODE_1070_length_5978_cov_2.893689_3_plen_98_part_00
MLDSLILWWPHRCMPKCCSLALSRALRPERRDAIRLPTLDKGGSGSSVHSGGHHQGCALNLINRVAVVFNNLHGDKKIIVLSTGEQGEIGRCCRCKE